MKTLAIVVAVIAGACASAGHCASSKSVPSAATPLGGENETHESDRAWRERIERGACSRLRDRRTDSPADVSECRRDQSAQPLCISYQGFAFAWYDLAENPPAGGVNVLADQTRVINTLGPTASSPDAPAYYQSPQYRSALHRLLNVALSPDRKKWSTGEQFSDQAYKRCMEGRPF